ncbi:MAG TPA: hypothetical protein VFV43_08510 [Limnobacter sp.]|nr:hypothetical protein [Limnobacter sp.]
MLRKFTQTACWALALLFAAHAGAQQQAKPLSPAQAEQHMGQQVLVDMKVRSSKASTNGYGAYVLNSETSARLPNNLSVVIDARAANIYSRLGIFDPASHFFGKRIRVAGVVSTWDGQAQILVGDPRQIEVLR